MAEPAFLQLRNRDGELTYMNPFGDNKEHSAAFHHVLFAKAGAGRSLYSDNVRKESREKGYMLVDTELYRSGGLFPAEYEYARRIVNSIDGRMPRGMCKGPIRVISDVTRKTKTKRKPQHFITTSNDITLNRELIADSIDQLQSISGIRLNQPQLIKLLEETHIDKTLAEFGEAETQIREQLAEALSMKLIGHSWPSFHCIDGGLYNAAFKEDTGFANTLNEAAKTAGYTVVW